jgi:hypothetical protein
LKGGERLTSNLTRLERAFNRHGAQSPDIWPASESGPIGWGRQHKIAAEKDSPDLLGGLAKFGTVLGRSCIVALSKIAPRVWLLCPRLSI